MKRSNKRLDSLHNYHFIWFGKEDGDNYPCPILESENGEEEFVIDLQNEPTKFHKNRNREDENYNYAMRIKGILEL